MPNQEDKPVRLIVGLGNPGEEYDGSRHNVGFSLVDGLLRRLPKGFEQIHHGYRSIYWRGAYAGRALLLQKPQTYMNLSGDAVLSLVRGEHLSPEEVLVLYDDMDLPLGKIRLRKNGGNGGHNGIGSIIASLGTEKFPRLRFGIGKMANGHGSADYVLSRFREDEQDLFWKTCEGALDALILTLRRGIGTAMNVYNAKEYSVNEETDSSAAEQKTQNTTKHNTTHQEV